MTEKKRDFYLQDILDITQGVSTCSENILFRGSITTDTRNIEQGDLFIALEGEHFDGADFLYEAEKLGASCVLVDKNVREEKLQKLSLPVIKVQGGTILAYQRLANAYRKRFAIPVIAVTGSNGKTTTKEITAHILATKFAVTKTEKNFNNEIGVPKTLLSIKENDECVIVELGMRALGEIESLARIVEPTVGIITNVGDTHIERLGSIENIARAKGELADGISIGGTLILNADDPLVSKMQKKEKVLQNRLNVITFGIQNPALVRAENISFAGEKTHFTLNDRGKKIDIEMPLLGMHNVCDALAAIATSLSLGIEYEGIKNALKTFSPLQMRFSVEKFQGITFINDAYNASPLSIEAALTTLKDIHGKRYFAVLGDMLELGDFSQKEHEKIGRLANKVGVDALLTFGKWSEYMKNAAQDSGLSSAWHFKSHADIARKLSEVVQRGDVILFKASRGMELEKVIALLKEYL